MICDRYNEELPAMVLAARIIKSPIFACSPVLAHRLNVVVDYTSKREHA